MDKIKSNVPAGLLDENIEFFLYKGKLMVLEGGITSPFSEITIDTACLLMNALEESLSAMQALDEMDIHDPVKRLEQFARCRFADCNSVPDLTPDGKMQAEYFECEKRGKCKYEGRLCIALSGPGGKITPRELEVIKLIAQGLLDKEIAKKLFRSVYTIETHRRNIEAKIGGGTKMDIVRFAYENNVC